MTSYDEAQRLRAGPAVSWGAILAGAAVAIASSILLLALGAGIGFEALAPWAARGGAAKFAITGAIWLIVTQWLAAALGGYITGRLRHRWLATHQHEVFFRDTAHGLVTWAVATLAVVLSAGASFSSAAGGAAELAPADAAMGMPEPPAMPMPPGMRAGGPPSPPPMQAADRLFRTSPSQSGPLGQSGPIGGRRLDIRAEAMQVAVGLANSPDGENAADDRSYLSSLVAANTGIPAEDAQKRVEAFVAQVRDSEVRAKAAADEARKAAGEAAIYTGLAMLIGAFIASVAAAIGGRLRDEHL